MYFALNQRCFVRFWDEYLENDKFVSVVFLIPDVFDYHFAGILETQIVYFTVIVTWKSHFGRYITESAETESFG